MQSSRNMSDFIGIMLIVCLTLLLSRAWAVPDPIAPSGSGTAGDPYLITNLANLHWIASMVNDQNNNLNGVYFLQTVDIDAAETKPNGIWGEEGWIPIGGATMFSGYYNGNGHSISGLSVNRPVTAYVGLFGYTSGATIANLTLTDCYVVGSYFVGGLAGVTEHLSTIQNCTVEGRISGTGDDVGGLVGSNSGSLITNCTTNCAISGMQGVGGLVGINSTFNYDIGNITKCVAEGTVSGYFYVGGLVGSNSYRAYITECCALNNVTGTKPGEGYYVRYIGGLVGMNSGSSRIGNCYATGAVLGEDYIGGLVGYNDGSSIINCYSTGVVAGSSNVGGLAGGTSLPIGQSFYDSTTSHQNDTGKGTPLSTLALQTLTTFTNAGWDFEIEDANGTLDCWDLDTSGTYNNGYPFLAWQNGSAVLLSLPAGTAPSAGDGTRLNPYQIASFDNLIWVAVDTNNWDKHYIQAASLNAAETRDGSRWIFGGWMPIGKETKAFTGSYDGKGHVIDSLYFARPAGSYQGLFGYTMGDTIRNLGVTNVSFQGKDRIGGLVGFNSGTVINQCFSSGSISGKEYAGGLIGLNSLSTVNDCYSTANLNGTSKVGGLVGRHENATLNNCYSTGSVTGAEYCGGLVGRSYNATAENCFWDTETSGRTNSQGGTAKTTAEMKSESTFTSSAWNFTDIWAISTTFNSGYPYLQWQNPPLPIVTLSFNATAFEFGQVLIGQSKEIALILSSTGNDTLVITNIESSNSRFTSSLQSAVILPGKNLTDTLRFDPLNAGPDAGLLVITSNAVSSPDTIRLSGTGLPLSGLIAGQIPCEFALQQNYPNPFNPTTTIAFALAEKAAVTLKIYDLTGREMAVLIDNESLNAGNYTFLWNAAQLPTGIYFYHLRAGDFSAVKKLVLVK